MFNEMTRYMCEGHGFIVMQIYTLINIWKITPWKLNATYKRWNSHDLDDNMDNFQNRFCLTNTEHLEVQRK